MSNTIAADEEVELPEEKEVGIMLFDNDIIRIVEKDELQGGKRGRKGVNIKPPKNANLMNTLYTTNLGNVLAFTTSGRMYNFSISDLNLNKDYSIYEMITPQDNEKVILLIDGTSFYAYHHLITISKNGYIKKSHTEEYRVRAKKGTPAVKLEDNDKLVGVYLSMDDSDKVFIVSSSGNYNFYDLTEVNATGRTTKGVRAIKLDKNEYIQTATIIRNGTTYKGILSITNNGKGKITSIADFPMTSKGIKGNQVMSLKNETLALVYAVPDDQEKLFISANNKAVILEVAAIPTQNRMTSGSLIIDARNSNTTIEIM